MNPYDSPPQIFFSLSRSWILWTFLSPSCFKLEWAGHCASASMRQQPTGSITNYASLSELKFQDVFAKTYLPGPVWLTAGSANARYGMSRLVETCSWRERRCKAMWRRNAKESLSQVVYSIVVVIRCIRVYNGMTIFIMERGISFTEIYLSVTTLISKPAQKLCVKCFVVWSLATSRYMYVHCLAFILYAYHGL